MEVVTGAMGSLLPKLGQLLMDEYNLLKRVKKDVRFLSMELESMHAALIKVGAMPRDQLDTQVKLWADEVRELSYNMEDVVDKFLVHVDGDGTQQPHDNSGRFKELKNKMISLFKKGKNHHRIADAVKEIKEQLQEVAARRDRNKVVVPNPTEPIVIDSCLQALYAEATELVGIYGKRDQELMSLLSMEGDDASNKRLKKVSIVGFGGLGKTTLARAVYDKIKGDFDCRAFVPVGQTPDMKKVLRDILIDLGNSHSDLAILDANQLIKKIHEFLENKRYLVIIDDIWDEKLWEGINFAFSNKNNLGSRLITTTRNFDVSKSCCLSADDSIYKMKPLCTDESRRLFHKRIFPDASGCPSEFQQVSEDILKKCGGVPLAIITIASALASGQEVKPKRMGYSAPVPWLWTNKR
ncbi:unnamed protein product [Triticum turgidum subsp. durum]|uniref:Uncharacterized protein n=1 Tax=Triticum turgidum subsp. durum TaxID=4567 RepID=A0A9R0PYP6_TRITD|nr:unnamed protein product [Triticum turgidum subsp. durum]